jgi:hypothetical protein
MAGNGDSTAAAATDAGSIDTTSSTDITAPTTTSTITAPTTLPNFSNAASSCLFPGGIAVPIQNASSWQTSGCSLGFLCKFSPK